MPTARSAAAAPRGQARAPGPGSTCREWAVVPRDVRARCLSNCRRWYEPGETTPLAGRSDLYDQVSAAGRNGKTSKLRPTPARPAKKMRPVHTDTGQLISADTEKRPKWAIHITTGTETPESAARRDGRGPVGSARTSRSTVRPAAGGDQLLSVVEALEQLHQEPETTEQSKPGAEGQHPSPRSRRRAPIRIKVVMRTEPTPATTAK